MKIYTKKGDQGTTWLLGGGPYPKDYLPIAAYGAVDELNSVIGCVLSELQSSSLKSSLLEIQKQLFTLGAELASVNPSEKMKEGFIQPSHTQILEKMIDALEEKLPPLQNFILPGGCKAASLLHLARTTCRRAEREIVHLSHSQKLREEILVYINRLSDLLFVMARSANLEAKVEDILWEGILK